MLELATITHVIGFQLAVALSSIQLRKHYSSFGIQRQWQHFPLIDALVNFANEDVVELPASSN
ncbi:hypothetical protein [Edaphobacter aggregans]|uniref:hypothetical protein n=1 Tax=Edaphobacter aggregans TaxID=570835 RepID=UPI0012F9D99C|nr:hypothetical protein [Edaphobacter aggregans]